MTCIYNDKISSMTSTKATIHVGTVHFHGFVVFFLIIVSVDYSGGFPLICCYASIFTLGKWMMFIRVHRIVATKCGQVNFMWIINMIISRVGLLYLIYKATGIINLYFKLIAALKNKTKIQKQNTFFIMVGIISLNH